MASSAVADEEVVVLLRSLPNLLGIFRILATPILVWLVLQNTSFGYYGAIHTSPDGVNWTARASGTNRALFGVAVSNGLWTIVGDMGTVLVSAGSSQSDAAMTVPRSVPKPIDTASSR